MVAAFDFAHYEKGFSASLGDSNSQAFGFSVVDHDVGFAFRARQIVQRGFGKIDFIGHQTSFPVAK
ncbi:hypothetical protein D3C71_1706890 [compost metagenome]